MRILEYVYIHYHCYYNNAVGWLLGTTYLVEENLFQLISEGYIGLISPFTSNLLN